MIHATMIISILSLLATMAGEATRGRQKGHRYGYEYDEFKNLVDPYLIISTGFIHTIILSLFSSRKFTSRASKKSSRRSLFSFFFSSFVRGTSSYLATRLLSTKQQRLYRVAECRVRWKLDISMQLSIYCLRSCRQIRGFRGPSDKLSSPLLNSEVDARRTFTSLHKIFSRIDNDTNFIRAITISLETCLSPERVTYYFIQPVEMIYIQKKIGERWLRAILIEGRSSKEVKRAKGVKTGIKRISSEKNIGFWAEAQFRIIWSGQHGRKGKIRNRICHSHDYYLPLPATVSFFRSSLLSFFLSPSSAFPFIDDQQRRSRSSLDE